MSYESLKKRVYEANMQLPSLGLVIFTWGNVSEVDRKNNVFAIKPSGVDYDKLTYEDIVIVSLETGEVVEGDLKPSSDTPTHRELYNSFPDISGIVHTHSEWGVSWAQSMRDVPAYGTTHADTFYGDIPCARKLTTKELQNNYELNTGKVIVETFKKRKIDPQAVPGILVSGHGPFTWGKSASDAVYNAKVLEQCCKTAFFTERINPGISRIEQELLDKHYYRKHGANAYYGQD